MSDSRKPTADKVIGLLPCSGSCNVGMLTTKAVVEAVTKDTNVNFVCSLGLPLGIPGIIDNAKKSERYAALNGCEVRCASKSLERVSIPYQIEMVMTRDLGIKKNKNLKEEEHLPELLEKLSQVIESLRKD